MKNCYILYNPKAGNGNGKFEAQNFDIIYCSGIQTFHFDMTKITSYKKFFEGISFTDDIVICGGDGTLNKFINSIRNLNIKQHIYYFPCGTGNDFMKDIAPGKDVVQINQYIANLPKVSINGNCNQPHVAMLYPPYKIYDDVKGIYNHSKKHTDVAPDA